MASDSFGLSGLDDVLKDLDFTIHRLFSEIIRRFLSKSGYLKRLFDTIFPEVRSRVCIGPTEE